ncbi:MAG: M23 family metallopeptidase [Candidatus Daviesbacteria bacterium]|nr:M23 family metallopeptidase [Candidatus Daviesbacteria bacterium]
MRKIIKIVGIILLILLLFFAWRMFIRFLPFIPHERVTISLPFSKEDDDLIFINPMGETDHHKPPNGHPGLDFAWKHRAPLIAVIDGKITKIEEHPPGGFGETEKIYDVELVNGIYAIRYGEMKPAENIKVGMKVNKGDMIGRGGEYNQPGGGLGLYYSFHWEFDYDSVIFDRLCPLTYFDENSKNRIEAIWKKVGTTYNGKFPEICSGFYHERNE